MINKEKLENECRIILPKINFNVYVSGKKMTFTHLALAYASRIDFLMNGRRLNCSRASELSIDVSHHQDRIYNDDGMYRIDDEPDMIVEMLCKSGALMQFGSNVQRFDYECHINEGNEKSPKRAFFDKQPSRTYCMTQDYIYVKHSSTLYERISASVLANDSDSGWMGEDDDLSHEKLIARACEKVKFVPQHSSSVHDEGDSEAIILTVSVKGDA